MTILDKLLEEIPSSDVDEQVKQLSDKIQSEEDENHIYKDYHPDGPNVFLVSEVTPSVSSEIGFLTLERDMVASFYIVLWTIPKNKIGENIPKKAMFWDIPYDEPKKIISEYGKILKLFKEN